jgi:hypothetical protein
MPAIASWNWAWMISVKCWLARSFKVSFLWSLRCVGSTWCPTWSWIRCATTSRHVPTMADASAGTQRKRRRRFTSPARPIRRHIKVHLIWIFYIGLISNGFNTSLGWDMILNPLWFQSDLFPIFLFHVNSVAPNGPKSQQGSQLNLDQMPEHMLNTFYKVSTFHMSSYILPQPFGMYWDIIDLFFTSLNQHIWAETLNFNNSSGS